jgi:inositol-phosphate phosphatase/L-galactose 1-phosphate phosphatase/histidinol-phosphatase
MNDFLSTVSEALEQSRSTIKRYFRQRIKIDNKADDSPVTKADRTAEAKIREVISRHHPDHGILGEEHGAIASDADYQWVIDPIDGTKSFISGMPIFGTLIGLTYKSTAKLGIIDMPILNELWVGIQGKSTTYNGEVCQASDIQVLKEAILYCTEPEMFDSTQLLRFDSLSKQVQLRRFGGDCFCYGLLASGQIDLVVEGSLHYYDIMALIPVIEGAGGIITDWEGQPFKKGWNGLVIAAATPELHQAALRVLTEKPSD